MPVCQVNTKRILNPMHCEEIMKRQKMFLFDGWLGRVFRKPVVASTPVRYNVIAGKSRETYRSRLLLTS